jgi:hypothetical protein
MAKNLGALAALAALGYMAKDSFGNKTDSTTGANGATAGTSAPEVDALEAANNSKESQDIADMAQSQGRNSQTIGPKPPAGPSGAKLTPSKPVSRNPRDLEAGMSRGTRPATSSASKAPMSNYSNEGRGREMMKAPSTVAPVRKASVNDIPTGGPAGWKGGEGEKVDSSELGRNISNTMKALGPGKLAGIGAIGVEMRGAKGVQEAYNKAASASRATEARAKADPTRFTSAAKSTQKNPAKRTKKFDDSESSVEFKRGGVTRADGIALRGKTRGKIY